MKYKYIILTYVFGLMIFCAVVLYDYNTQAQYIEKQAKTIVSHEEQNQQLRAQITTQSDALEACETREESLRVNLESYKRQADTFAKRANDYQALYSGCVENQVDTCSMYNAYDNIYEEKQEAWGLYWWDTDFYCVWADKRTLTEQDETDRHEYCHYLINNDYTHFCEEAQKNEH